MGTISDPHKIREAPGAEEASQVLTEGAFDPSEIQTMVAENFCGIEMKVAPHSDSCATRLEMVHLGAIDALRYTSEGKQYGVRRWTHVRHDKADFVSVFMPVKMSFILRTGSSDTPIVPGEFCFIATNRPFSILQHHQERSGSYQSIYVKIPGSLIRSRLLSIDDLCGRVFPIVAGPSGLMRNMVEAVLAEASGLTAPYAERAGQALLDVIGLAADWAVSQCGKSETPKLLSQRRIFAQAKLFIDSNLSDTNLNASTVARHCQVSVRYLHAAFAASDHSVAAYIRDRRLSMCRSAFQEARLDSKSITQIISDWGFTDPSAFSRLYRSRFGSTASRDRAAARMSRG